LLNVEEARYLVVGATAMQLWGTTRATRDIDILIDPTVEAEAERGIALFEVEGVPIPTVSLDNLIESKRTGRTQDNADIEVLEALRRRHAEQLARADSGDAQ
jgi:hypothetical protein